MKNEEKNIIIIGLSGKKQSGKNTVARIIRDYTYEDWELKAYADPIKEIALIITGKYYSYPRRSPVDLGDGSIKGLDKDIWIKSMFANYHDGEIYEKQIKQKWQNYTQVA